MYYIGFPTGRDVPWLSRDIAGWDGMSHVKEIFLSCCPFVPGQKKILVPVSLCPGTRAGANVPGQTPLSRDVPGQKHYLIVPWQIVKIPSRPFLCQKFGLVPLSLRPGTLKGRLPRLDISLILSLFAGSYYVGISI